MLPFNTSHYTDRSMWAAYKQYKWTDVKLGWLMEMTCM